MLLNFGCLKVRIITQGGNSALNLPGCVSTKVMDMGPFSATSA